MEITQKPSFITAISTNAAQAGRRVAAWLGMAASDQVFPRKRCHFTTVPIKGVPRKHLEAAIRLRLQQLGVFEEVGFAYRVTGDQAHAWYWDDAQARLLFAGKRVLPWPEPLWRKPISESGVRLVACSEGYELEGLNDQGIFRSRWFMQRPSESEQQAVYRDLGLDYPGGTNAIATIQPGKPGGQWRISTGLAQPISTWALIIALVVICAGGIAAIQVTQLARLNQSIHGLETEAKSLRQQSATAIALESALTELRPTLNAMDEYTSAPRQTHWLAELAKREIIGSGADVYLTEWNYTGGRVTATFRFGPKARSTELLAQLEKSGLFSNIALVPEPPTGTVRLLLQLPEKDQPRPNR